MPCIRLSLIDKYPIMIRYCLLFALTLLFRFGNAQATLSFCEDLNDSGQPDMASNSFMVDNEVRYNENVFKDR